ncbi:chorismate lyase [Chromatiaceae bacterium AAb-1]|nr:chorismate lyase [Chromatiaceae bacterium AAb-1]
MVLPAISLQHNWQDAEHAALPAELAPWLLEAGSLTARLKAHSQTFRLQCLQQQITVLPLFLSKLLPDTTIAQVREVILWCNDKPCVYAQSWLPQQSLQAVAALSALGEQPLGEYLFNQQGLSRSPIEVTQLHAELPQLTGYHPGQCWARRSVFRLNNSSPLLVAEVFLPEVVRL